MIHQELRNTLDRLYEEHPWRRNDPPLWRLGCSAEHALHAALAQGRFEDTADIKLDERNRIEAVFGVPVLFTRDFKGWELVA